MKRLYHTVFMFGPGDAEQAGRRRQYVQSPAFRKRQCGHSGQQPSLRACSTTASTPARDQTVSLLLPAVELFLL